MSLTKRSSSLWARMIAASVVLALLVAVVFAVLIRGMSALDDARRDEARSKDVLVATLALEKLTLDLETGLRGYVLTADRSSLQPFREAEQNLGRRIIRFEDLASRNPQQQRRARVLARQIRDYVSDYAHPVIDIVPYNLPAAQQEIAREEGERRMGTIRAGFERFKAAERELSAGSAEAAGSRSDRALGLAIAGLVACVVLVVLFGIYLARSTARPVREVASAASRLAAGDLSTRLSSGGPGEVGELTTAFNNMAEELERNRTELESQNEQLRQSERRKSELVRIVSHELRTPLASILGFTSVLLRREVTPDEQRRYLEIIDSQGRRLSALLNDFLDAERLEEGQLELVREMFDMGALVAEQVELFSGQSGKHKLDTELPAAPLPIHGDPNRLAQVIGNLLSNAIKYSPDGGVVHVVAEQDNGLVRVSVRDEGLGIADELQQRVFAKFFRGDADASGIPGSGLGLTIARSVVEAHGGRMNFESRRGQGSKFWLELPIAANGQ
jgi:signal transduction histidine kinase